VPTIKNSLEFRVRSLELVLKRRRICRIQIQKVSSPMS